MATLQVRDLNDKLYDFLRISAKNQKRSISQEVISIIEEYLNNPQKKTVNATLEFLSLSGSWEDSRSEKEIVKELRKSRTKNSRLGNINGIFD